MKLFADLHIHGKYSQATSKDLTVPNLEKWAKVKGINLLGTGDFTHPKWIQHIKEELKEEDGILKTKTNFPFLLQSEISLIYSQSGKGRRIHNVIFAPSLDVVQQITDYLLTKGRIDYDGRPIFKIPCPEFVENLKSISKDIEIFPAHCLIPQSLIHTKKELKKIKEITTKDFVITHKGRYKKVEKIYKRKFSGKIIRITPACLKNGTYFTSEHPVYSIKTYKSCKNVSHTICKPSCAYLKRGCKIEAFKDYKGEWNQAQNLEVGDVILYPRYNKIKDKSFILLSDIISSSYKEKGYVKPRNSKTSIKNALVKNKIEISGDFCRLVGYYLAEGYCTRDYIAFTFSEKEKEYVEDVKRMLRVVFGRFINIQVKKEKSKGISIFVNSNILKDFFKIFYVDKPHRSFNKCLPAWMLDLPLDKLKELILGWWRGDAGYTSSLNLSNQVKLIFLKLGIIPSIITTTAESVNLRRKNKLNLIGQRIISARNDTFHFHNLSFFGDCCGINKLPEFRRFITKLDRRRGWIDEDYVYLPIIKINKKKYEGLVYNLEVKDDNSYLTENLAVHNCWTPWFSMFGSMSGFNSVEECFGDQTKNIFAFETGLSSDPLMNWRLSQLDKYSILSFSDLHSFWPWRIGRECTIFNTELTYKNIIKAIRTKEGLEGTIEVDPNLGKYHYTGHRKCNVCLNPKQSLKLNNICPNCGRPLTVGVLQRVEELADREEGFKPKDAKPFYSLIPLSEIISRLLGKAITTKTVWSEYNKLIEAFKDELTILMETPKEELIKHTSEKIAEAIIRIRTGKIKMKPGYDGEYGYPVFDKEEEEKPVEIKKKQNTLKDYM
ncbi:hypothetical protein KY345_00920 [Candidatus Woesearchaeota archaeon]|nr:hypothetical protein [Candidatus Woesearchaeota archaeon]